MHTQGNQLQNRTSQVKSFANAPSKLVRSYKNCESYCLNNTYIQTTLYAIAGCLDWTCNHFFCRKHPNCCLAVKTCLEQKADKARQCISRELQNTLKRIRTVSRNQSALGRKPFLLKICFLSCLLVPVSKSLLSDLITTCTLPGTGLELAGLRQ